MNEMLCDYRRMMSELGIPESKAKDLLRHKLAFPGEKIPVTRMDAIIEEFVSDGIVRRPVRKAGRPVTMKEGFTGDRVTKTITMDSSVKHMIEKQSKFCTMSGFIEDAVIMYNSILMTGIDADDVIDLLAKSARMEKKLEIAEKHLETICVNMHDNAEEEAKNALMEMSACL